MAFLDEGECQNEEGMRGEVKSCKVPFILYFGAVQ